VNVALAILWKDLVTEWRSRERLVAMLLFALLVVLVFHFAFDPARPASARLPLSGLLWVTVLFTAILGFNRAFALELENEALSGLALVPTDRGWIFLGKALANLVLLGVAQLAIVVLFRWTFGFDVGSVAWPLAGILGLGSLGLCTLGTLFGAISARTRFRELMMPLLFLPIAVPILVGAVQATNGLLRDGTAPFAALQLLIVADVALSVVSFIGFEYILDE
jgi:heme exporter protein B